jgi:hypothetical protein
METKQFCYRKANFQISKAPTFVEDSSKKLKKIKNKSNKILSTLIKHKLK